MRTVLRVLPALKLLPVLVVTGAIAYLLGAAESDDARAAAPAVNACGCYKDSAGTCYCGKKGGKCVCPGECEPKGCEEKRAKEMEKEMAAETKRAREAEKKQEDEEAARERKAAAPPADDEGDDSASDNAAGDPDGGASDKAKDKKGKKSKKAKKSDKGDKGEKNDKGE